MPTNDPSDAHRPPFVWASDRTLRVRAPEHAAHALAAALGPQLRQHLGRDLIDLVPTADAVTLVVDAAEPSVRRVESILADALAAIGPDRLAAPAPPTRTVEIPVRYDADNAPDLARLAAHAGLTPAEVIALHTAAEYHVDFLGFSPGFAYIRGLDPRLHCPRRDDPRRAVPAGSVAIADDRTAVYPQPTPGGWNLIGRTDLDLFDPAREPPNLLAPGDRVRFIDVTPGRTAPAD